MKVGMGHPATRLAQPSRQPTGKPGNATPFTIAGLLTTTAEVTEKPIPKPPSLPAATPLKKASPDAATGKGKQAKQPHGTQPLTKAPAGWFAETVRMARQAIAGPAGKKADAPEAKPAPTEGSAELQPAVIVPTRSPAMPVAAIAQETPAPTPLKQDAHAAAAELRQERRPRAPRLITQTPAEVTDSSDAKAPAPSTPHAPTPATADPPPSYPTLKHPAPSTTVVIDAPASPPPEDTRPSTTKAIPLAPPTPTAKPPAAPAAAPATVLPDSPAAKVTAAGPAPPAVPARKVATSLPAASRQPPAVATAPAVLHAPEASPIAVPVAPSGNTALPEAAADAPMRSPLPSAPRAAASPAAMPTPDLGSANVSIRSLPTPAAPPGEAVPMPATPLAQRVTADLARQTAAQPPPHPMAPRLGRRPMTVDSPPSRQLPLTTPAGGRYQLPTQQPAAKGAAQPPQADGPQAARKQLAGQPLETRSAATASTPAQPAESQPTLPRIVAEGRAEPSPLAALTARIRQRHQQRQNDELLAAPLTQSRGRLAGGSAVQVTGARELPTTMSDLARQLLERLPGQADEGRAAGRSVCVECRDSQLGQMRLVMDAQDGRLTVSLREGSAEMRAWMQASRQELSQTLRRLGFEDVSFDFADRRDSAAGQRQRQEQDTPSAEPRMPDAFELPPEP